MRALRASLAALLVLALGCSSFGQLGTAPSSRLDTILKTGELRVGLTGDQPPLNMRSKSGSIIGLEVDMAEALADSMRLEARLVPMPFADLLPALERGDVDLVISGVTITPARNARVAFAGPYFISGKSVLTKSETLATVSSSTVLDDPERSFAALAGSTSEMFVQEVMPRAKLVATADYDAGVQLVLDGKVDALIADFPICIASVRRHPELSMLRTPFTVEPLGIALPANDPLFVNLVQNYLVTLEETGLLTRFKAKWFGDSAWLSELP